MARLLLAALCLVIASCTGVRPPVELAGLWSAGQSACAAGVGVRFGQRAIEVVYDGESETLFDRPRYQIEGAGEMFRVRIIYDLPNIAGGARGVGAHGVVVLARQAGGGIAPEAHNLIDGRTGAARLRIRDDPAASLLTLEPCGAHPWREGLRGRRTT
jgi:hypothetical protein